MRNLLILSLFLCSTKLLADGIDRIHLYKNGELIFMTEKTDSVFEYSLKTGDTLFLDVFTDWSTLDEATLTLKNRKGDSLQVLNQIWNNRNGAQFYYVLKEEDLKAGLEVLLNYNIEGMLPKYFLRLNKGRFE